MSKNSVPSRLLQAENALLLVVDIQEKLLAALPAAESLVQRTGILIEVFRELELPILISEQYPQGLGHTVPALLQRLPASASILEKSAFGCGQDVQITDFLTASQRSQILVCGVETHVCVNQTVHQLLAAGYQVHLAEDATCSRHSEDQAIAISKMRQSGVIPSSTEMAMFELLGTSRHPLFKSLQALIKSR